MTSAQWVRVGVLGALLVLLTATTGVWGVVMVVGILLMVFLHELGHYVAAKRAGMKVTEFFIGFGPRIWSFRRGETEYGLKVVPAGAYVKIIGMHALEEVAPEDEARSYRQGRFRNRFMVVTAGPLMNLGVALFLIWTVLAITGAPGGSITDKADETKWNLEQVYPGTGAAAAGLKAGDKITAIDGDEVIIYDDLRALIMGRAGDTVEVTYVRAGATATVPVDLTPYVTPEGEQACCLGVQKNLIGRENQRVNPLVAVPQSFSEMGSIVGQSLSALGRFASPSGLKDFGSQVVNAREDRAEANAPTTLPAPSTAGSGSGTGSSSEVKGENRLISLIGVFQIGTSVADSGVKALLMLFVVLNISLGIINLLPLLPFDGGHAVIAIYEKVQEKRRHMATRYFTDINRLMPLTYVVVLLLVGIFLTTTYLDLANPLTLD